MPVTLLAVLLCGPSLAVETIELRAPLTAVARAPLAPMSGLEAVTVVIEVGTDAPADLGVALWLADYHGRWDQTYHPQALTAGRHHLRFMVDSASQVVGATHHGGWAPLQREQLHEMGLVFWSQESSAATIRVSEWALIGPPSAAQPAAVSLHQVSWDGSNDGLWQATTGQRSTLQFLPYPQPTNPYASEVFAANAVFRHADGGEQRIPAFWYEPMALYDRGDSEEALPAGAGTFAVRFRPRRPGVYQVHLETRWQGGVIERHSLPELVVSGSDWDGYVRIDTEDPRFFAVDGEFFWPIGLNLHSIFDVRAQQRIGTQLTPARGSQSYQAYLERLAAAGATSAEIWLSSWNLALEWRADWPGYHGLGRYHQGNAQRLDAILDQAQRLGIRINLVVNNHGQVSTRTNTEWEHNPYNVLRGGIIEEAQDYFRDPQALVYQERYRRYVVARYADHPAILGWKLSSEINLTAGRRGDLRTWHQHSSARWQALDSYGHPLTTHWSGTYTTPDRAIVTQDGIHYVCINAYQGSGRDGRRPVAELLWNSTQHPRQGLQQFAKPVLVTEYGGSHLAGSAQVLLADHRSGGWAGLVSGHGGSPMLWWFEWVDQHDLWGPYQALSRFVAGEDLRDPQARSVVLEAGSGWWAGAWVKPGHLLGYLLDRSWAGTEQTPPSGPPVITIGNHVAAGTLHLEWWCADRGEILARETLHHPGGRLQLRPGVVSEHRAWKLWRADP